MMCADCTDSYTETLRESEGHHDAGITDAPDRADAVFTSARDPWNDLSDDEKRDWNLRVWGAAS